MFVSSWLCAGAMWPRCNAAPRDGLSFELADGCQFVGIHLFDGLLDGGERAGDVFICGAVVADGDAHGSLAVPGDTTEKGFARGEDICDDSVGLAIVVGIGGAGIGIEEANESLVDDRGPEHFGTGQ